MKKYLIPITTILLASCEQNSHAQNTAASSPPAINTECKNLHKVVDIDDLLYQMYSNIDSHCLFEMPTGELEKIWGIPIVDYTFPKIETTETNQKLDEVIEYRKKVENEMNTIYLLKWRSPHNEKYSRFDVWVTLNNTNKNYFFHQLKINLEQKQFPKRLPEPNKIHHDKGDSIDNKSTFYLWHKPSQDNNTPILYIRTELYHSGIPAFIRLYNSSKHPEIELFIQNLSTNKE